MDSQTILLLIGAYLFICFLVAAECGNRGWSIGNVFVMCALISPIIGAILFSHYRQESKPSDAPESIPERKEDPALSNLISSLEKGKGG